jgi:iron complex outermembrane receptor protein
VQAAIRRSISVMMLLPVVARAAIAQDQEYSPKWLTDLEASYQVAGYRLAVGAQNLFDMFPDRNSTVNSFNGIQTLPRQSPFGINGRAIYARIGRKF